METGVDRQVRARFDNALCIPSVSRDQAAGSVSLKSDLENPKMIDLQITKTKINPANRNPQQAQSGRLPR